MVNLKNSHSEIKLFWKYTKKQLRLSCAWIFFYFQKQPFKKLLWKSFTNKF